MGKQIRQIKWDERALGSFISIIEYIYQSSPNNAKSVKARVINIIKSIPQNPELYRVDELKENNEGSFRVFNSDSIRISYKIESTAILITRVRHSSQEPISY
ncbi:MAG: hypothetical protein CFE21_03385 [Bacteroidetes bacterium B1(2017)]|nr:MAG: hypothetical protein CFE21_03385 [Bacteroidetes bacterium B1(2017)]